MYRCEECNRRCDELIPVEDEFGSARLCEECAAFFEDPLSRAEQIENQREKNRSDWSDRINNLPERY